MRVHAEHRSPPQEPWSFGDEVEAVARIAIERRYQLLPYLYTLAHRAHRLGEPILRPLLYDFPDRAELQTIDDQLMIGPLLMIAPVCEPGRRTRTVRLPPGVWYDFHTGKRIDGGTPHACSGESPDEDDLENAPDIEPEIHAETAPSATARCCLLPAAPGRMPILVRGGSCLTLGPPRQATGEPLTALIVDAYPDAGEGTWTLTEDAGDGWDHCHDGSTETELRVLGSGTTPALLIGQRAGRWQPPPRQLVLRLHLAQAPTQLLFDGIPRTDWWWDQDQSAAILTLEDDGRAHRLSLE
jgi:alpha-glucosidase